MRRRWRPWVAAILGVAATLAINLLTCRADPGPAAPRAGGSGDRVGRVPAAGVPHGANPDRADPAIELAGRDALRLEGQVVDEHELPVAGARIQLSATDTRRHQSAISGADGSFAFEQLPTDEYRIIARSDTEYGLPQLVSLTPLTEPLVLKLAPGSTIALRVLDGSGGASISGATVTVDDEPPLVTDAAGTVRLRGIGPVFYWLYVTAPGFAPLVRSLQPPSEGERPHDETVELQRGAPISGRVLGPDDRPVGAARVCLATSGHECAATATSDGSGTWHLDAVAAATYDVTASSPQYGPVAAVKLSLDGATAQRAVVVHVAVDGQLVGTVVDATGTPVADARVHAAKASTWYVADETTTDAYGRFELLGRIPDTYVIAARSGRLASTHQRVPVADGARIELRLVVQDVRIAGTVVDSGGKPVAGAEVGASETGFAAEDPIYDDATSDLRGRFELDRLVPGTFRIVVRSPGTVYDNLAPRRDAWAGTTDLRLVVDAPATLSGRALLAGLPVEELDVWLSSTAHAYGRPIHLHAPDGRFALRGVAAGAYEVTLSGSDSARARVSAALAPGRAADLGDVVLVRGPRIGGHVLDATGTPVADAEVTLGPSDGGGDYTMRTDSAGAYAFDGVALGDARSRIGATHPTRGTARERAIENRDATVDLVLLATGGVDGEITGAYSAYADVRATGSAPELGGFDAPLTADGSFHLDGMLPGDYWLTPAEHWAVGAPPAPEPAVRLTVSANRRTHVHLVAPPARVKLHLRVAAGGMCDRIELFAVPAEPGDIPGSAPCSAAQATFPLVAPGSYRALAWLAGDGEDAVDAGTAISVTAGPVEQAVTIPPAL